MTELLEKAFNEALRLAPEEQDALAAWILEELASEKRWVQAFARSHGTLERLAKEAMAEYRSLCPRSLPPQSALQAGSPDRTDLLRARERRLSSRWGTRGRRYRVVLDWFPL